MRIVAIIQARMGSNRLPGKVLKDLGGHTMLNRVIRRVRQSVRLTDIVVATSVNKQDDAVIKECLSNYIANFRGSEQDVLDRYYLAAQEYKADVIVRVTADCPFVDPSIIDLVIEEYLDSRADYVSNTLVRTYPQGLDVEVFSFDALSEAAHKATHDFQRTHVTPYIYRSEQFRLHNVSSQVSYSRYRWTVDEHEDLIFARAVYSEFVNEDTFSWKDVLKVLEENPNLVKINQHVTQKGLFER